MAGLVGSAGGSTAAVPVERTPFQEAITRYGPAHATNAGKVAWSPDGRYLAINDDASPFVHVYRMDGLNPRKMPDPAVAPGNVGQGVAWSPDGQVLVVTNSTTSPYIHAWAWSDAGFGAKYADPGTLPPGHLDGVAFHPDGDYIFVGASVAGYLYAYNWTNAGGFGARVGPPAATPGGSVYGIDVSPDGGTVFCTSTATPYLMAYPWTGAFGARAVPAALAGAGERVRLSPDGAYVAVSHLAAPGIAVLPWDGAAFGVKVADPAEAMVNGRGISWSPDGTLIAAGDASTAPYLIVFNWSGGAFGARATAPVPAPDGQITSVAFSPDGKFLAVSSNSAAADPLHPIYIAARYERNGQLFGVGRGGLLIDTGLAVVS